LGSKPIFVTARLVRAIHAFALAWQLGRGSQDVAAKTWQPRRGSQDVAAKTWVRATRAGITIQSNLIPVYASP
jgi:hypothetical protein